MTFIPSGEINTAAIDRPWEKTFNSFSGTDIVAIFGNSVIGEIQGVSWTTTREKAPLYVMGRINPIAYSRGKRGIAGSMIFLTFDTAAILSSLSEDRKQFFARRSELNFRAKAAGGPGAKQQGATNRDFITENLGTGSVSSVVELAAAWYPDQVPPFTVILTAENEYGGGATMAIIGTEILNNGSGVSVDDITTDEQMTFVALEIRSWRPLVFLSPSSGQPNNTSAAQAANLGAAADVFLR